MAQISLILRASEVLPLVCMILYCCPSNTYQCWDGADTSIKYACAALHEKRGGAPMSIGIIYTSVKTIPLKC